MRVGLKADPQGGATLWVGLQPDGLHIGTRVGLKADPQDSATLWVGLQPDALVM